MHTAFVKMAVNYHFL